MIQSCWFQNFSEKMYERQETGTYATFRRNRLKKAQWEKLRAENLQLQADKISLQETIDKLAEEVQKLRQILEDNSIPRD